MSWLYWQTRIREILGLPVGMPLSQVNLPSPWFLVPDPDMELTGPEADNLFKAIRSHLFSGPAGQNHHSVLQCIKNLGSEESLPLLYAMRHVARQEGQSNRYWPVFYEQILGGQQVLNGQLLLWHVQVQYAPVLADIWIDLNRHTRGALYFPRAGKRYIKWPLAHAGLLREDEETLRAFGEDLFESTEGEKADAPLQPDDLEEFVVSLRDWLNLEPGYYGSRLSQLVRNDEQAASILAELAQNWLLEHWNDLVRPVGEFPSNRVRSIRRHLQYDAAEHRIVLEFGESHWPGQVNVSLHLDDKSVDMRCRYLDGDNQTQCECHRLPLLSPHLPSSATLSVGNKSQTFSLPSIPSEKALIFAARNGHVTRQWQLEEEYYILTPGHLFRSEQADVIFEEHVPLGPPEGDWSDYQVIWARTRDPFLGTTALTEANAVQITREFEKATDDLRLPSFGTLWRPKLSLVGGMPVDRDGETQVFAAGSAPWIQLTGVWDRELPLALTAWDSHLHSFVTRGRCQIPPANVGGGCIIEADPPGQPLPEGTYQVLLDETPPVQFRVATPPSVAPASRFAVKLELKDENGIARTAGFSRRDLDNGALVIMSWPFALLTITAASGPSIRRLQFAADEYGLQSVRWRNLGISATSNGPLTVAASWRGLAEARLTFADSPFITREGLTANVRLGADGSVVSVEAIVSNRSEHQQARLTVIDAKPWRFPPCHLDKDLSPEGELRARARVRGGSPKFLIISPAGQTADSPNTSIWGTADLGCPPRSASYPLDSLRGEHWWTWERWLDFLRKGSLPPRLYDLVGISGLGLFLNDRHDLPALPVSRPHWQVLENPQSVERLAERERLGFHPIVTLLANCPPGFLDSPARLVGTYLSPASLDHVAAAARGELVGIPLQSRIGADQITNLESYLTLVREDNKFYPLLHVREWLYGCSRCGLLIKSDQFNYHKPTLANMPSCVAMNAAFTSLRSGQEKCVILAVLHDPLSVLDSLSRILESAISGDGHEVPPYAEPWLDKLTSEWQDSDEDASAWVSCLISTARQICDALAMGALSEGELANLGQTVRRYRGALNTLFDWLVEEMA